jgi:histidine ammonia-lyase
MPTIILGGKEAEIGVVQQALDGPVHVELAEGVLDRVEAGYQVITQAIARGDTIYGVNTGFGKLANRRISQEQLLELQRRLIASHMVGVGEPFAPQIVRAVLVVKLLCLIQGRSGVRPLIVRTLVDMLNADLLPIVPSQGSVGASGDLAPLAHLVGAMTGIGDVLVEGERVSAAEGFARCGVELVELGPKEGVALINGTQVSTALGIYGLILVERVLNAAVVAGALTLEAAAGRQEALDARIQEIRHQRGQIRIAETMRRLVADSEVLDVEFEGRRLQDPYSLRCMPQVMGASLDLMGFAADLLSRELNSVSDNPLMFPEDGSILSGGNFHGEPVAFAADILALAVCEIGSLSERRIALLMDESMSGLPPFLMKGAGLNSGFLMTQVTAAALVAENRSRAFPASVDSIPTSAGQEDHVSMATHGARRLKDMARNAAEVVAIELIAASQGLDLRNGGRPAPGLAGAYRMVRDRSAFLTEDRALAPEIEAVASDVLAGSFELVAEIDIASALGR